MKIEAIIEKNEAGHFSIYANNADGLFADGETENEAKEYFLEVVEEQAEFYKSKRGEYPEWYSKELEIEYRYDFSGFFKAFPFINVTQFAKAVGINPSLMRKYKEGLAFASENQKATIQKRYDAITQRMSMAKF